MYGWRRTRNGSLLTASEATDLTQRLWTCWTSQEAAFMNHSGAKGSTFDSWRQWISYIQKCRFWILLIRTIRFSMILTRCRRCHCCHPGWRTLVLSIPWSSCSVRQISAGINCYLSQLLVTFSLYCWRAGVWQMLREHSFATNSLSNPSLNTDPHRVPACTHSLWPLLCGESIGISRWVCLNEVIITLQLAHVTELCLCLPFPNHALTRWR